MVTIQLKFCKTETWYLMVSACPKASPPRNPLVFYFTLDFGRNTFHIKKKKAPSNTGNYTHPNVHTSANVLEEP